MPLKISGMIFITACVIFAFCGLVSGSAAYYGLALMSLSVGLLLVIHKPGKKSAKERKQRKKGKFEA